MSWRSLAAGFGCAMIASSFYEFPDSRYFILVIGLLLVYNALVASIEAA